MQLRNDWEDFPIYFLLSFKSLVMSTLDAKASALTLEMVENLWKSYHTTLWKTWDYATTTRKWFTNWHGPHKLW